MVAGNWPRPTRRSPLTDEPSDIRGPTNAQQVCPGARDAALASCHKSRVGVTRTGGPVALVTGAGSGIGRGTAQHFLARGYSVVAVDMQADPVHAGHYRQSAQALAGSVHHVIARAGRARRWAMNTTRLGSALSA
jgi:short chain dehydrogenase